MNNYLIQEKKYFEILKDSNKKTDFLKNILKLNRYVFEYRGNSEKARTNDIIKSGNLGKDGNIVPPANKIVNSFIYIGYRCYHSCQGCQKLVHIHSSEQHCGRTIDPLPTSKKATGFPRLCFQHNSVLDISIGFITSFPVARGFIFTRRQACFG